MTKPWYVGIDFDKPRESTCNLASVVANSLYLSQYRSSVSATRYNSSRCLQTCVNVVRLFDSLIACMLLQLQVATTAALSAGGGEGRKRFICSLCHISVLRLPLHLHMKHKLAPGSEESRHHPEASRNIREEDVRNVSILQDLMNLYEEFLNSYSGGQKASTVADQELKRTARILEDLLEGKSYSHTQLRLLKDIGRAPGGLLWRYEQGEVENGNPFRASTITVCAQSVANFARFLYLHPEHLRGKA
jgi:hypothetical protein